MSIEHLIYLRNQYVKKKLSRRQYLGRENVYHVLQQWPCYLQEPVFESRLRPVAKFLHSTILASNAHICAMWPTKLTQSYQGRVLRNQKKTKCA